MMMRKLIIQIPCLNEEESLPVTLRALPRSVAGFERVEWLVIDDGSKDRTVEVARAHGVDHIVSLRHTQGLAKGFMAGLEACLKHGADVIVNTDADNQYDATCIPDLVRPILAAEADMVVGARPIAEIAHFPLLKKLLQWLGSWAVRVASGTQAPDAPSGFRAIHRDAAIQFMVYNDYTYTLETLIQAGRKGIRVTSVPVRVNGDLRPSRLVKSIASYVSRSILTIFRIFLVYKPFRAFLFFGILLSAPALALGVRYLWLLAAGAPGGHVQSLILAGILFTGGFISFALAIIADLLAINRTLMEDVRVRLLRAEIERAAPSIPIPAAPRLSDISPN
jgi:glycosyltransferase involved in cell wall biosynthesis